VADLERLARGCLLASFDGPARPKWLRPWLDGGLGGVVLFASNVAGREQLRGLTAALREDAPALVVGIDEEGGDVTRLEAREGSSYPGALALGVVDDTELTAAVAGAIASELAAAGVNLNLAPVADVNTDPLNPVIGVRAFGSEPALVARHVAAHVRATQAAGVAACAKHFPGHGDTRTDSHHELPVVDRDLAGLRAVELVPFAAAVGAGVRTVMTAHLRVPALGPEPVTLNRTALAGLLREELGFAGAVIGDALDMRAIAGTVGAEEGAVRALAAGVDGLCLGPSLRPDAVHAAVVAAVRSGRLAEERVAEAAARVAAVAPAGEEARATPLAPGAAARALSAEGDVRAGERPLVVELVPEPLVAAGPTGASLGRSLAARCPAASVRALHEEERLDGLAGAGGRVVLVLRDAGRHAWQQRIAEELLALRPDSILVETGLPGWAPSRPAATVATHGAGRASLDAAAELLLSD
jgi:beta-N-acetylhexosaminidase